MVYARPSGREGAEKEGKRKGSAGGSETSGKASLIPAGGAGTRHAAMAEPHSDPAPDSSAPRPAPALPAPPGRGRPRPALRARRQRLLPRPQRHLCSPGPRGRPLGLRGAAQRRAGRAAGAGPGQPPAAGRRERAEGTRCRRHRPPSSTAGLGSASPDPPPARALPERAVSRSVTAGAVRRARWRCAVAVPVARARCAVPPLRRCPGPGRGAAPSRAAAGRTHERENRSRIRVRGILMSLKGYFSAVLVIISNSLCS